jgi:ribonuclease-3
MGTSFMDDQFSDLQDCIDYHFSQVKLLRGALTHSSYANEFDEAGEDNERLEFLGDAVLELCISEEAFLRYPEASEGQMTRIRSRLVKEKSLADAARVLHLERYLLLGRGEESQGGRTRDSLLSDALEALFGAVFLDGGYTAAKALILRVFTPFWPEEPDVRASKDHKSRLQEITQQQLHSLPVYRLLGSEGPEHAKSFLVEVELSDGRIFQGRGGSVKKAEQTAASRAVQALESPS